MNLTLIAVDKLRQPHFRDGVDDYANRIRKFLPFEQMEVAASAGDDAPRREAEAIRRVLPGGGKIIALDVRGKLFTTDEFWAWLMQMMNAAVPRLTFVLGGAVGLHETMIQTADLRLSLSPLTLPHELARLVLVEQIYRALTLWKGLPYHK
jgi:23S rRNA (pseudouridine1915-N3)-methyltransferase